jgi:NAD(P)-dependent dehydrogenase (short-subunit alcohol dehydrogenase family)
MAGERNGADIFFECSGSPDSIRAGLEFVRKCGTFVHVGICKEIHVDAPWNMISAGKELTIVGCNLGRNAWPRAFDILKQFDLSGMITHRLPLEQYNEGFDLIKSGIKIVLDPTLPAPMKLVNGLSSLVAQQLNLSDQRLEINNSVAFVTGSSRGIGRAIAIALAEQGARVIIHGTSHDSPSYLNEGTTMTSLAREISQMHNHVQVTPVWGDLSTKEGVSTVLSQIKCPIDILVCCAGGNIGSSGVNTLSGGKPSDDTCLTIADADATSIFNRNFWTSYLVCQSIVPHMVDRRRGQVILIGSTSALIGREKGALYTISKAALHQYMRCLATEVRASGVTVNCIAPGPTLTERYKRNIGTDQGVGGRPEHVANAVVRLLQMPFVHGQIIRVDGGEQTFAS